jgi:acyl-CoA thioesterase FadM
VTRAYEMRHTVSFEETNLVGNVYYANHVRWQGRCRELFLRDHCPEVLDALRRDLALVTLRVSCEYLAELEAFDVVRLSMRLAQLAHNRLDLTFDYHRLPPAGGEILCARGEHSVASMRRTPQGLEPCPIPAALREALQPFGG